MFRSAEFFGNVPQFGSGLESFDRAERKTLFFNRPLLRERIRSPGRDHVAIVIEILMGIALAGIIRRKLIRRDFSFC